MSQDLEQRQGGAVAQRTPAQQFAAQIHGEAFREQIRAALPENVTVDRFVRATTTALLQKPELADKVTAESFFQAVIRCAQDGLLPDGKEAAITNYGDKATYMPMIGGFRKIAGEHGWTIDTQVVYAADEFEFELGAAPNVRHRPARPGIDRGAKIAAYAICSHRDGRRVIEVFTAADVLKTREISRAKARGPWVDWEERMWEKAVGRRAFAKIPLGEREAARVARMVAALDLDPADVVEALYGPQDTHGGPVTPAAAASPGTHDDDPEPGTTPAGGITQPQRARLWAIAKEHGHQDQAVRDLIRHHAGDESTTALTQATYDQVIADLEKPAQTAPATDDRATRAGQVPIPDWSVHADQTIQELAATEPGLEWLLWATRPAGRAKCGDVFSDAAITYISGTLPAVWAEHGKETAA